MKKFICILLVCMMTLSLAACGGKEERGVSTDGSTSMSKVINALGEAFMENNSGVNFTYNATGSGTGIKAVKGCSSICNFPIWHSSLCSE